MGDTTWGEYRTDDFIHVVVFAASLVSFLVRWRNSELMNAVVPLSADRRREEEVSIIIDCSLGIVIAFLLNMHVPYGRG